jgi:hypothetical protein
MGRQNAIQTNWSKGEISPLARGRVDVNLYQNGANYLENFIVRPQGAITKRPGTKYVHRHYKDVNCVLVPFEVSDQQAYMLEFGPGYIHFYKNKEPLFETTTTEIEAFTVANNGGLMQVVVGSDSDLPFWGETSGTPDGVITNNGSGEIRITYPVPHTMRTGQLVSAQLSGIPGESGIYNVVRVSQYAIDLPGSTYSAPGPSLLNLIYTHGLMAGDRFYVSGAPNYPTLTEQFHVVKSVEAYNTFTIANVAYVNNGNPTGEEGHTIPIEVVTDFTANELSDIRFAQSADVLYIVHPNHPPQKLVRLDDDGDRNDWLLSEVDFTDGPYLSFNDASPLLDETNPERGAVYPDVYLSLSSYAHTATATVTAGSAFVTGDDDKYIEYRVGDQWQLARLGTMAGGETSTTVSIIDNVLLYLDESTKITSKNKVTGSSNNSSGYGYVGNREAPLSYGRKPPQVAQKLDPGNGVTGASAAGDLEAQFSNTFSESDIGKFVRYTANTGNPPVYYWALIDGHPNTTGAKIHHAASVAMASNNATAKYVISGETRTIVANAVDATTNTAKSLFQTTDVGRKIRLGFAGRWTWGTITTYTSASQVTITLQSDMPRDPHNALNIAGNQDASSPTTGITYEWRLGAWSDTTGWPRTVVFHEQRLWFGGNLTIPQTLWASTTGGFEDFTPTELDSTVLDDSAITYTLASAKANSIKWMVSGPAMTVGTNGGEWQVRASSSINDALTPSNLKATEYTGHGATGTAFPSRIGSSIVFVDRSSEKVHELFYSYEKDAVDSDDLTVISEHILRSHGGGVYSAYQQKPHSVFWVSNTDGTLSGMTFNKKQEVVAWHHHEISGADVGSIAVIPNENGSEDELWMVCTRTINGSTVYYIEVLEEEFYSTSSRLGMKFLDSHILVDGWTSTSITGLNYLEAQSVYALVDGTVQGPFTVASGAITLTGAPTTEVLIGKVYNADVQSLPVEGGSDSGTSQGQRGRIAQLDVRVFNSLTFKYGPNSSTLDTKSLGSSLYTGTERVTPKNGIEIERVYYLRGSDPYPLNILFVVPKVESRE